MDLRTVLQNRRRTVEELGEMASDLVPEPHKSRMEEFVKTLVEVEREDANARLEEVRHEALNAFERETCQTILDELNVEGFNPDPDGVVSAMDKLVYDAVPDDDRFIEMERKASQLKSRERALASRSEEVMALSNRCRELQAQVEPNHRLQEQVYALSDANASLRQRCEAAEEHVRSMVREVDATAKRNSDLSARLKSLEEYNGVLQRERDKAWADLGGVCKELDEAREWLQAGSETKTVLRRERDAAQQQILNLQRALKEERDNCLRLAEEVDRLHPDVR